MAEQEASNGDTGPGAPAERVVSSVRVESAGTHERVAVWNRGGLAGTLVVTLGDGAAFAELLEGRAGGKMLAGAGEGFDKVQRRLVEMIANLPTPGKAVLLDGETLGAIVIELGDLVTTLGDESAVAWRASRGLYPPLPMICAWCGASAATPELVNAHIHSCPQRKDEAERKASASMMLATLALDSLAKAPCSWAEAPLTDSRADCTHESPCPVHKLLADIKIGTVVAPGVVGRVETTVQIGETKAGAS